MRSLHYKSVDRKTVDRFLNTMVFLTIIELSGIELSPEEDIENVDGEISIAFWSFAFVLLLIVTVWFYITQIAPMRRSPAQIEEVDKEEEVAKRILEHLSDDLRFTNDNVIEDSLTNASVLRQIQEEDLSVYEYVDGEIHIHYSQYAWDDENSDATHFPTALGTGARRHSMENMDLIFPGLLPSIIEEEEEEECEEETDSETSEKSQDTDIDGGDSQADTSFSNSPAAGKAAVNNNGGSIESSVNKECNYSKRDTNIVISLKSQDSQIKNSATRQDRVIISEPPESIDSRYPSDDLKSPLKDAKPDQNNTFSLSQQSDNRRHVADTQLERSSTGKICQSKTHDSAISVTCETVTESTSGGFHVSSVKDENFLTKQDVPLNSNNDEIEPAWMFTLSNCDLEPSFKQDANGHEKDDKLCASTCNTQTNCWPAENGLDTHSARDSFARFRTDGKHGLDNTAKELVPELNDAPMEKNRGLTGIDEKASKSQGHEFQLNGFGDDIVDCENTTHAWIFFSMSGGDEITSPQKRLSSEKLPSGEASIPTIIIDSCDDGLQSDKSIAHDNCALNGNEITSRYSEFETDIDIDDVDLIESDELENEGEFSVYFKRHVSVTDLDKILSEEGQSDTSGDSSKVLEATLCVEEPNSKGTDVDVTNTSGEISQDAEAIQLCRNVNETTHIVDESNMNMQKSVAVVTTRLSDCLDNQPSEEDFEDTDSGTDNSPPASYTVESLFDDVSFQKDGVYGELVLSQLNENHHSPDENSFDPLYSEDWCGFSEELRRERKPFLFTIPEDEEIGPPEFGLHLEDGFGGARENHVFEDELNASSAIGDTQLLKAPIATMETYDSDFDLDENEETNKNEPSRCNGKTESHEQTTLKEIDISDTITMNGVTTMNDVTEKSRKDVENKEADQKNTMPDKLPTRNGLNVNSPNLGQVTSAAEDKTRSLKIVKKIKIFVRKEVNITKEDDDLMKDNIVKQKQFIQNPEKDKSAAQDEADGRCRLKEELEEDILVCRAGHRSHNPYEVVTSEIGQNYQFMQTLNHENVKCDISEISAEDMKVTTKREKYVPAEPKSRSEKQVSRKETDVSVSVTTKHPPTLNDKEKVKVDLASKIKLKVIKPPFEDSCAPESETEREIMQTTAQDCQTNVKPELQTKVEHNTIESRNLTVKVAAPETTVTELKSDALKELECEALVPAVEVDGQKSGNTRDLAESTADPEARVVANTMETPIQLAEESVAETNVNMDDQPNFAAPVSPQVVPRTDVQETQNVQVTTKLTAQKTQAHIIPKPEWTTVKTRLWKSEKVESLPQIPTLNDEVEISGKTPSTFARNTITTHASLDAGQRRGRDTKQPFAKVSAKGVKTAISTVPKEKMESKTDTSPSKIKAVEADKMKMGKGKEEIITSDSMLSIQAEPYPSYSTSKSSLAATTDKADLKKWMEVSTSPTPVAKLPTETPSVKISVKGKGLQDDKGKRQRKTYLSSCNIRLTRSHEDLRFTERTPEALQESIEEEEEECRELPSPQSDRSQTPVTPIEAFETVEPPSIHSAKITVQEVIGDKQRIVILNVKKKVHGKARWKSLNDLDSINLALTSPRRSSDLGTRLTSFAEEGEKIDENENKDRRTVVPVSDVKLRHGRRSLTEMESSIQPHKSSLVKVTALQSRESATENEAESKTTLTSVAPKLLEKSHKKDEAVTDVKEEPISSCTIPIIQAIAPENHQHLIRNETKTETAKVGVTSPLEEVPSLHDEPGVEVKGVATTKGEFKTRISGISSKKKAEMRMESVVSSKERLTEQKPAKRVARVHDISQVVEVIPRLERETITEIEDEGSKGNKIKVHVPQRMPPPEIEQHTIRPQSSPTVHDTLKKDGGENAAALSAIGDVDQRQGRGFAYTSLRTSPNLPPMTNSYRVNRVFLLEGVSERSVSSLSSIEDEEDGITLREGRIMVTDLDALLAQQDGQYTVETPLESPDIEKQEVKEKFRVLARMEPVPKKVIRVSKDEDEDNLVIRTVRHEEPIVVEPVIIANAAEQEEAQVISAFLVNDGYDDDELDNVFLEEYADHEQGVGAYRTHSSDADSETSSVSSLPFKQRHRHTRASLEASSPGVRNRTDSSGSSKAATPVAELEVETSRSSTSRDKALEISLEESFSFEAPERSRITGISKTVEYTSAFTPVSRTADDRRPRAGWHGHKSDEELGVQNRRLGSSFREVMTLPGLQIDRERFKEAADSRKSMPDLSARKEQPVNDSPYLRGLSAHTRRWLSQNVWMDSSGLQDKEDLMTSDLFLYPSNRFQPGSNIDASFLSLANERDFPDDISVSTLSTRPQSPMSEFSFAGETPFWGFRNGNTAVIKCSNPRCQREEVLFGGEKTTYTSCPACFTYYCARACRRIHWSEHKRVCFFGRINSYIRSFIYLCHKKEALKFQLSKTAKDGQNKKGRGSVMVTFASAQSARKFMTTGCTFFPSPPTYSSLVDLQAEGVISKHRVALMQHIKDYEPNEEFVLNLAIVAGKIENLPANPVPRRKVNTVLQVVKIPLSNKLKETMPSAALPTDPNTETKVFHLPKCARHEFVNDNEARRHYCRNISKNLKQYGIRLKHDYPDVYEKLCLYVDQNIRFTEPLTVYGNQGKKIVMCKIMPEGGEEESKA